MKNKLPFLIMLISLLGASNTSYSQLNAELTASGDALLEGRIGLGTNPNHRLHIVDDPTTANTVSIEAEVPPPAGRDMLEIIVPASTADGAQLLEFERGVTIVAAVNADGSARFKSVSFPDGSVQETAAIGPIAYGFIQSSAAISSGSGNFTAVWNNTNNRYDITIDDENYFYRNYSTVVTAIGSTIEKVSTSSSSGNLIVYLYDSAGNRIQGEFQFVTFK